MTQVSGPLSVVTEGATIDASAAVTFQCAPGPTVLCVHNAVVGASSPMYQGRTQ